VNYEHKQAIVETLNAVPHRFVYVRLKRGDQTLVHCKVRRYGPNTREIDESTLRQQFGSDIGIKWTGEDHAEVTV
jgi:hypothetical protein